MASLSRFAALAALALALPSVRAADPAPPVSPPAPATAVPGAQRPPLPEYDPPVDEASALSGRALVEALRGGGFVIFLRHAEQGDVKQVPDCSQPSLAPEGIAQAEALGKVLHELAIPFATPVSSPACRAIHTARRLGFGDPDIEPMLEPSAAPPFVAARDKLLSTVPPAGKNTILVGHHTGAPMGKRLATDRTGMIVFRPDGKGGRRVIAHVLPKTWAAWPKDVAPR